MYIVSSYQSREFGLGFGNKLTPTLIAEINCARRNIKYISKEDAILINGNDLKIEIEDDPNLRFFSCGC